MSYPPPYGQNQPPPYDPNQQPQQPPQYGQPVPPSFPQYQPGGYGQPVPPPKKKSSTGMIIGIIAGVLALVCLICGGLGFYIYSKASDEIQDIQDSFPTAFPTVGASGGAGSHTVRYELEGTGEALITWARGSTGTNSETASLPWSKEVSVDDNIFGVTVLAFGRGADSKVTSCRILIDGVEKRKVEAVSSATVLCTASFVG